MSTYAERGVLFFTTGQKVSVVNEDASPGAPPPPPRTTSITITVKTELESSDGTAAAAGLPRSKHGISAGTSDPVSEDGDDDDDDGWDSDVNDELVNDADSSGKLLS